MNALWLGTPNFGKTNLTFTQNRTHNTNQFDLKLATQFKPSGIRNQVIIGDTSLAFSQLAVPTAQVNGSLGVVLNGTGGEARVRVEGTVVRNADVFLIDNTPIHNGNGETYGIMSRPRKVAGNIGPIFAIEGYLSDLTTKTSNYQKYYGLTGDVRAEKAGYLGGQNIGVWSIAQNADTNVSLLASRGAVIVNDSMGIGLYDGSEALRQTPYLPQYRFHFRDKLALNANQTSLNNSFFLRKETSGAFEENGSLLYLQRAITGATAINGRFITLNNGSSDVASISHTGLGTFNQVNTPLLAPTNIPAGRIIFTGTNSILQTSNVLVWDSANGRFGIGVISPDRRLDVSAAGSAIIGRSTATGTAVYGFNSATSGNNQGLLGQTVGNSSGRSTGLSGVANGVSANNIGAHAFAANGTNNIQLLIGASESNISGQWGIYSQGSATSYFASKVLVGSTVSNSNSIGEYVSTNRGLLPPRLTTAQRNAVTWVSSDDGMMLYCTDCTANNGNVGVMQIYQSSASSWRNLF